MITQAVEKSMLNNKNAEKLRYLYDRYLENQSSVEPAWAYVFSHLEPEARELLENIGTESYLLDASTDKVQTILDAIRVHNLIRAYRVRGHMHAKLDPLNLDIKPKHSELELSTYGYTAADLDRQMPLDGIWGRQSASLQEIINHLERSYCETIGFEYMHIHHPEERAWIQQHAEEYQSKYQLSKEERQRILCDLLQASDFESFLHVKYPGAKRFGLEGGESTIPAIQEIIRVSANNGVEEIVFGMAHRGRLNVLANVIGKEYSSIFAQFQGVKVTPDDVGSSGDVKYHLGYSNTRIINGHEVKLSLTANPSHLEAVNPVVMGKVRAKQALKGDNDRKTVMGLLIHGDASIAGQGIVAETLTLSQLPGYRMGGTLHVVINNQIGFTTSPMYSRSSPYCTDVAKIVQAPIFHVNGDDVEAVVYAAKLAAAFRHKFQKDAFLSIKCYRRNGHNEIDEPAFTQPKMYAEIRNRESTKDYYIQKLIAEGHFTTHEVDVLGSQFKAELDKAFEDSSKWRASKPDWLEGHWKGLSTAKDADWSIETGVDQSKLEKVAKALVTIPKTIKVHSRLQRVLDNKKRSVDSGQDVDWAMAESIAFGTLLIEGHPVRLSGQDSTRGTFSQRHAALVDQETEEKYIPLNHIEDGQAVFEVIDSPLSEAAVLGYEYGYTNAAPHTLVMWEAQFGDFTNGAQVIIDQFISSAEAKWLRMSGLVMLLPHGYEGQGPEHSSARLERYLQQSAENNWQVIYCTTPANHFHALRRQVTRSFRKPLIAMTPKSLLRHRMAVSTFADMATGTRFMEIIPEIDATISPDKVKKVILCSGKVYYDILSQRLENKQDNVAIVRIEQLYPFPKNDLIRILKPYAKAQFIWCQEEPENMGAWTFIDRRMEEVLYAIGAPNDRLTLVARTASASTATGYMKVHEDTQQKLVEYALRVE